jgi:hypothetical protein
VLDELAAAVTGFCEEARRNQGEQWDRTVTRLPGEERTAEEAVSRLAGEHPGLDVRPPRGE